MNTFTSNFLGLLKERPDFILMLALVGGFLYYMDVHDKRAIEFDREQNMREDIVANQRIQTCHDIQNEGIKALDRNSAALTEFASTGVRLAEEIDNLTITVTGNAEAVHRMEGSIHQLVELVRYSQGRD